MDDDSLSGWIEALRQGEEAAAARLWNHFYARLIALARHKLRGIRRVADEEDVAAEALESFFLRAQRGQFPQLHDRDDLWHVLVTITERKALNQARDQRRQKRGGGRVRGDSALGRPGALHEEGMDETQGWDQVAGPEPSPEFAVAMIESLERLLHPLDDELRRIALGKLEGRTNEEIAEAIGRSTPTVERRLRLIRDKWKQYAP